MATASIWAQDASAVAVSEEAAQPAARSVRKPGTPLRYPMGHGPQIPPEVIKAFDKDGDGVLNEAEMAALKTAVAKQAAAYEAGARDGEAPAHHPAHPAKPAMRGPGPQVPSEVVKAFDKDGDGVLNAEERQQMRDRLQEIFKKYGTEGSAALTPEQIEKAAAENPDLAEMLKKFGGPRPDGMQGTEGKGRMTRPEGDAPLPGKHMTPQGRRPGMQIPPEVVKAFDKDGDGVLNAEEREQMHAAMKTALSTYDKDGDGKLSAEEIEALKKDNPALGALVEARAKGGREGGPNKDGKGPRPEGKGKPGKAAPAAPEAE